MFQMFGLNFLKTSAVNQHSLHKFSSSTLEMNVSLQSDYCQYGKSFN